MRILLISDTHGHVDRIPEYAEHAKADICIHAGDFGFYDSSSADGMSQRELYLQVKHSDLPENEKAPLLKADAAVWEKAIAEHKLLGNFHEFLDDEREFVWPVYAIWGNHDDSDVVLRMVKKPVPYLHILHERTVVDFGDFVLLGIGGNCPPASGVVVMPDCEPEMWNDYARRRVSEIRQDIQEKICLLERLEQALESKDENPENLSEG